MLPAALVGLALSAAMSGDPALPRYVIVAALGIWLALFLFLGLVNVRARHRAPEPVRFGDSRVTGLVFVLLLGAGAVLALWGLVSMLRALGR